jgi:hypothetical protein
LQEQGKLVEYYHKFAANCQEDPTGEKTLAEVLEFDDWSEFQSQWEAFVSQLSFAG